MYIRSTEMFIFVKCNKLNNFCIYEMGFVLNILNQLQKKNILIKLKIEF